MAMVQVHFTPNIQRHVVCPPQGVNGATVADALAAVFATNERVRGYVLDDQGGLRNHMVVFCNGRPIEDRKTLSNAVHDGDEIYVMQALSGG